MIRNTFAGNPLDRGGHRRTDELWLREQLDHPEATIVALRGGKLLVSATSRGGSHSLVSVAPALARREDAAPVFLGISTVAMRLMSQYPNAAAILLGSVSPLRLRRCA